MKLLSLSLYKVEEGIADGRGACELSMHYDLSSFSFFHRNTVKEHIKFHSRTIVARTAKGQRQTIAFDQDLGQCHVYVAPNGLGLCVLADKEYPMRVAFQFLSEVSRTFS